ncbi:MAG: phage minor capsid protein [Eubacteriales bacterium]|nr:phage minor capsid protein [Eubacteriales bacterium]
MLKPKYIENLPDALIELYAQAEADIIADMARRIVTYDFFIPAAEFQFRKLQDTGLLHDEIIKRLSQATGVAEREIKTLMKDAGATALKADDSIYRKSGLSPTPLDASPSLQAVIAAGAENTSGLFKNLTRTTANTATKQFENALDRAYMQVTTGAFDYNSAIRTAVKDLSAKGVAAIDYPTGRMDYLEVAVRRATVTGVNQTAAKLQEARADEMGSDLVETTAHAGARPEHQIWQGQVFSRSGKHPKYPDFVSSTGYGTGPGLCGWNCRHNFFPYFEGVSEPAYSDAELDDMNSKDYVYNGHAMTEYEASQKQRAIQRNIRKWKREEAGMKAAGLSTDESKAKVAAWQAAQIDFIEQTGLKRQYGREQIGKSVVKVGSGGIIKVHKTLPRAQPNVITQVNNTKGGISRNHYDSDGKWEKQITNNNHGNPKKHPFGAKGEHAHDILWEDGKVVGRPVRELTEIEREENKDILWTRKS